MKIRKLKIRTPSQNYNILIGSNLVFKLSQIIKSNSIKFNKNGSFRVQPIKIKKNIQKKF